MGIRLVPVKKVGLVPDGSILGKPRVNWLTRREPILCSSPLGTAGEVVGLNLAPRGYSRGFADNDRIILYSDLARDLDAELSGRPNLPRAVFICPLTEPFPPLTEVQAETVRIIEVVARHGVEAWLMTRGFIRPSAMRVLEAHRSRVKIAFGLMTLDRRLQRALEPLAAPPRLRLRQIAGLRASGVSVHVALEPLVPGVTDTRTNLMSLLEALAGAGIRHVTAGYMFLPPGSRATLSRTLKAHGLDESVLEPFDDGPILKSRAVAAAQYLPKSRRQRGYAALMALAANMGITVSISLLSNPDFEAYRHDTKARLAQRQPSLF